MKMRELLLGLSAAVHIFAAIVWIGGIFFILFVAIPAARKNLEQPGKLLGALGKRFTPWANTSILLLFVTGILMSLSTQSFSETASLDSPWSRALSAKIFLVLIMAGIHFYRGWVLAPRIAKVTAAGINQEKAASLQKMSLNLVKVNFLFALAVFLITGALYAHWV